YLLKPIDIAELKESVGKARRRAELNMAHVTPKASESGDGPTPGLAYSRSKITLPHTHGYHVVDLTDITYVEADSNYSIFHLKTGEKMIISKPLKEFEAFLEENHFMRIHKSVIINFH